MFRSSSFRRRLFIALVGVATIPAAILVIVGTVGLGEMLTGSGTAGPWESVAESGRDLLERVEGLEDADPALVASAERHRSTLSESVRLSRVYTLVAQRFMGILPLLGAGLALLIGSLALLIARQLTRSFSQPVQELIGWTETIAREEPLPVQGSGRGGLQEFQHLKGALRSMAGQLEEGRLRAVESARLRSWTEMARRVAHELKNPLTPMRVAATGISRMKDPAATEAGEIMLEEISRLDEMARSFAQFGSMPEGPKAPIDLRELLDGLARQHTSDDTPVEVAISGPLPLVEGHLEPLTRVFRNLLVNALEAHRSGASSREPIVIHAGLGEGGVQVAIRDRGPGIPEDQLNDIWTPDFTTKRRGTGLGLPLVQQTVRAHGGAVSVRNQPTGGAEFVVTLPTPPEN